MLFDCTWNVFSPVPLWPPPPPQLSASKAEVMEAMEAAVDCSTLRSAVSFVRRGKRPKETVMSLPRFSTGKSFTFLPQLIETEIDCSKLKVSCKRIPNTRRSSPFSLISPCPSWWPTATSWARPTPSWPVWTKSSRLWTARRIWLRKSTTSDGPISTAVSPLPCSRYFFLLELFNFYSFKWQLNCFSIQQFARIIVEVLEEEMGSRFTADVKDAWEDGFRILIDGVSKNLKYVTSQFKIIVIKCFNSQLITGIRTTLPIPRPIWLPIRLPMSAALGRTSAVTATPSLLPFLSSKVPLKI